MKKSSLLIAIILVNFTSAFSQITLSYTYTTDPPDRAVKLSLSGLKYVHLHSINSSVNYFTLYNPDHTIFKTVTVPPWSGRNTGNIAYISESLFDLDTLIEYYVNYSSSFVNSMRICNENGVILLERDSAEAMIYLSGAVVSGYITGGIFPDGNATKLMVQLYGNGWSNITEEIYDLPGRLACLECSDGVVNGLIQQPNSTEQNRGSIAAPNPFNDFVKIKYSLPANVKHAFVNLFDITGNLIKKKEIDNHFDEIIITSDEIKQGAYIYQIVADDIVIANSKIIKI